MTTIVDAARCHNCGAALAGRFCAQCGQEDKPLDPTTRELVREAASELSDVDGRVIRSVRRLFLSPGFLTREYVEGRRVGWLSPIRLYLTFSVAYFALIALTHAAPFDVTFRFTGNDEGTRQMLQRLKFSSEEELQHTINDALTTWMPRAMFLLVPSFALLIGWVRRRSPGPKGPGLQGPHGPGRQSWKYPHHLVFACHVFAVFFGAQALALAAGYATGSANVGKLLGALSVIFASIYTVAALRAVYGGTLGRAVAHTAVVLALYWVAAIITTAVIIVPVFFLR